MKVYTEIEHNIPIIEQMIQKHGCAAEHNPYCYIYNIESSESPIIFTLEEDMGVLAKYNSKDNSYTIFTEILASIEKKSEVLLKFLDYVYSLEKKPDKIWVELESDTRRNVLKKFKDTKYKCNRPAFTLIWPVFDLETWTGDTMQGGDWKDMRYYWNKFFRDHKVEFVTADKVSKEDLKQLVYDWKKSRTTGDKAYIEYYIHAIDTNFKGYDTNRIMIVDGKIGAMSAGFKSREGYFYASIGLYNKELERSNEIANMDDLINLKKLGYKIVDFGGVEKKSLEFKKKFRPTKYYKTHTFSIVLKK